MLVVGFCMFMPGSACVIGRREALNCLEGHGSVVTGKDDKARTSELWGSRNGIGESI